jgi:hypothetical protein
MYTNTILPITGTTLVGEVPPKIRINIPQRTAATLATPDSLKRVTSQQLEALKNEMQLLENVTYTTPVDKNILHYGSITIPTSPVSSPRLNIPPVLSPNVYFNPGKPGGPLVDINGNEVAIPASPGLDPYIGPKIPTTNDKHTIQLKDGHIQQHLIPDYYMYAVGKGKSWADITDEEDEQAARDHITQKQLPVLNRGQIVTSLPPKTKTKRVKRQLPNNQPPTTLANKRQENILLQVLNKIYTVSEDAPYLSEDDFDYDIFQIKTLVTTHGITRKDLEDYGVTMRYLVELGLCNVNMKQWLTSITTTPEYPLYTMQNFKDIGYANKGDFDKDCIIYNVDVTHRTKLTLNTNQTPVGKPTVPVRTGVMQAQAYADQITEATLDTFRRDGQRQKDAPAIPIMIRPTKTVQAPTVQVAQIPPKFAQALQMIDEMHQLPQYYHDKTNPLPQYHHGDKSMADAILRMAHHYDTNDVPVCVPEVRTTTFISPTSPKDQLKPTSPSPAVQVTHKRTTIIPIFVPLPGMKGIE